jgi:uncharacterized membrane protein (DUF485 family)
VADQKARGGENAAIDGSRLVPTFSQALPRAERTDARLAVLVLQPLQDHVAAKGIEDRVRRNGMNILVSFLSLLLYIAIILLIAYVILWVVRDWFSISVDANVLKFAKIVVGLICLIAIVVWLSGVLGMGGGLPLFWHIR